MGAAATGMAATVEKTVSTRPAVTSTPSGDGSSVHVERLVVTSGIEGREPVATTSFAAGKKPVYAFVEMKNPTADEQRIVVTFEHQGRSVGHVKLSVPAEQARWRTWGRTHNVTTPGAWTAVVSTEAGDEIARKAFEVTP